MTLQSLAVRKACERGVTRTDWLTSYHSFSFGDYIDPRYHHFGVLRVINEDTVKPGKGFATHSHKDMEIITLVLSGQLAHKDSMGNGSIIKPGDIQVMSAGTGVQHSEYNASTTEPVHFLQIWLFPNKKSALPGYQQKNLLNFTLVNQWQWLIGTSNQSISVNQQAGLAFAVVNAYQPMTYKPTYGRLWLQVITGGFTLDGQDLNPGDGVGIENFAQLTITSTQDQSQLLLFDLPMSN